MEVRARARVVHVDDAGKRSFRRSIISASRHAGEVQVLVRVAADDVDPQAVAPAQHRLDVEAAVGRTVRRVAGELAERALLRALLGSMTPSRTYSALAGARRPCTGVRTTSRPVAEEATGDLALVDVVRHPADAASMNSGWAPSTIATGSVVEARRRPEHAPQVATGVQARAQRGR